MDLFGQVSNKTSEDLVPYILQCLDDKGLGIYNTLDLTVDEKKSQKKYMKSLKKDLTYPNQISVQQDLTCTLCISKQREQLIHFI